MVTDYWRRWMLEPVSIAPLAVFRVLFGSMMFLSTLRFWLKGWIKTQYIDPSFHFTYMGFEWVKPLGTWGMYLVFMLIGGSALLVALGRFYRVAISVFFVTFTYVELIDVTYYLNHYYFISVVSFLMIWLPAGNYFSLDAHINPSIKLTQVPRWMVGTIRLQLGMVYFFAGLAKLNADWMLEALPMKIWLPAKSHLPWIGDLMYKEWVAYLFSWFGAVYDLSIPFLLINQRSQKWAYIVVIGFHVATAIFFPAIGMFPYIMMASSTIFFSGKIHQGVIDFLSPKASVSVSGIPSRSVSLNRIWFPALLVFFFIQIVLPLRYLAYPGPLFWTEEGYRFSWRVMLMEKAGTATFTVEDASTGRKYEVNNAAFLTKQQEKMMSTQPDMLLQYARYLAEEYRIRGLGPPRVTAQVYVTLNGRRSAPFVNDTVDLSSQNLSFKHYKWILPFEPTH